MCHRHRCDAVGLPLLGVGGAPQEDTIAASAACCAVCACEQQVQMHSHSCSLRRHVGEHTFPRCVTVREGDCVESSVLGMGLQWLCLGVSQGSLELLPVACMWPFLRAYGGGARLL